MRRKLDNLSQEEMISLLAEYDGGMVKVNEILAKYNLDYNASKFALYLPGRESETVCKYCNIPMLIPRSRTTMHSSTCPKCGHLDGEDKCICENCKATKLERHNRFVEHIHKYIIDKSGEDQKIFEEVDIMLLLRLLNVYDKAWDSNLHCLIGAYMTIEDYDILENAGIIGLDRLCPIEAFEENDELKVIYYKKRAYYQINISDFDEKIKNYKKGCDIFSHISVKERYLIYQDLMLDDLLRNFENIMEDRGMRLNRTEKGIKSLKYLISKLSYAEISNICFRVGLYYLDKVTTGVIPKYQVASMALSSTEKFYNNSITKGWHLGKSSVAHAGWELSCFVKYVMNKPIDILENAISEEDFN